MDNHLVVLVQDESVHIDIRLGDYDYEDYSSDDDEPATLLAFNLEDHTVQEVEMDSKIFGYYENYYTFLKYGENQIIKYGNPYDPYGYGIAQIGCITIESFKRTLLISKWYFLRIKRLREKLKIFMIRR